MISLASALVSLSVFAQSTDQNYVNYSHGVCSFDHFLVISFADYK